MNYLTDTKFLSKLAYYRQKTIYARITSLDFQEFPIESIEGRVTSGSINIDGGSITRRSCSLTLISENINLNDLVWTLDTKFKLEIGVYNLVDLKKYPEILWFPQGIYTISSFSSSISASSISISISGKDKMSFLNGEISGYFGQSTILDSIEEWDDEIEGYVRRKYDLKHIIKDMVYTLGNEKLENIFINDLDNLSLKMVKYIGQSNLYIQRYIDPTTWLPANESDQGFNIFTGSIANLEINEEWVIGTAPGANEFTEISEDQIDLITYSDFDLSNTTTQQSLFRVSNNNTYDYFLLQVLKYGDIAGYEPTPTVFNDDLIAQPGDTIAAMLTKIVQMLGNSYEFFYDVEGRFIFQKKKTYLDTSWSPLSFHLDGDVFTVTQDEDEFMFDFTSNELISSMSINPGIDKVKNDFVVYGETENKHPIHLRYAIDKKPTKYINWNWVRYYASNEEIGDNSERPVPTPPQGGGRYVNWRAGNDSLNLPTNEQKFYKTKTQTYFSMANQNFNKINDNIRLNNQPLLMVGRYLKIGNTVHKIIRIEDTTLKTRKRILVDDPEGILTSKIYPIYYYTKGKDSEGNDLNWISSQSDEQYVDWRELIYQMAEDFHAHGQDSDYLYQMRLRNPSLFLSGKSGYEQYYTDIMGFWPELYRYIEKDEVTGKEIEYVGWNLEKLSDPNTMLYWLEFLEGGRQFEEISVPKIGDRTQIAKNKKSTVLFEPNVPPLLFFTGDEVPTTSLSYTPIRATRGLESSLTLAAFPTSAKTIMNEEINSYTTFSKAITLSTVPIYSLDVNKKIRISTDDVRGQFIVNRISLPLNYDGMMSITLSEIIDSLY